MEAAKIQPGSATGAGYSSATSNKQVDESRREVLAAIESESEDEQSAAKDGAEDS